MSTDPLDAEGPDVELGQEDAVLVPHVDVAVPHVLVAAGHVVPVLVALLLKPGGVIHVLSLIHI